MERHRIQLQPQSYRGVTGVNSRQQQYQSTDNYEGAYQQSHPRNRQFQQQQSSELDSDYRYDSIEPSYHQQQQLSKTFQSSSVVPIGLGATALCSTPIRISAPFGSERRDHRGGRNDLGRIRPERHSR